MTEDPTLRSLARRSVLGVGAATIGVAFAAAPAAEAAPTISQGELDRIAVVASVARFAGIDATGAADSSTGLQAAINATPDGGLLVIPTGTYLVGTAVYPKLGKSIRISAYGATLIATTSAPIFSVSGTYGSVIGVSAVATVTPTGLSPLTQLTLASAPGWAAGTVIKIVADDLIPERRPGSGGLESRVGEFAVVRSSSGTQVQLGGLLRDSYTTGVRVAAISEQTFAVEGGTFRTADARLTSVNNPLFYFSRLRYPRVRDIRVPRAGATVLRFASCFGYLVEDADVGFAVDNADAGLLGYGVADVASSFGQVRGGLFAHVRHSYTDDTNRVAAGSEISGFGRSYGTVVSGVNALMTTSTSFDTHHCSQGVTFLGCTATGGVNQAGQGQSGFQLRGIGHRVIGCTAIDVDNGVQIYDEAKGGDSRGHYVSGLTVTDARGAAVRVARRPSGHPKALVLDPESSVQVSGVQAERTNALLSCFNATVTMTDARFRAAAAPPGTGDYHGVYAENSLIRLRDVVIDFEANTSGIPRPIASGVTAGSTPGTVISELTDVEIRSTADVAARTWGALSGANHLVRARGLRLTVPFRYMPGESLDPASSVEWSCDTAVAGATDLPSSAAYTFGNTEVTQTQSRIVQSPDPVLFLRLTATNTLTMAALPAGRRTGQQILIHNAGSRSVTIVNGSGGLTALTPAQNRVLAVNDSIGLFWDGAVWRQRS